MTQPSAPPPASIEFRVPAATLLKVAGTVLLFAALVKLAPVLMVLFLALLLAVALAPIPAWFKRRGLPRWVGITAIALGLGAFYAVFFAIIIPSTIEQISGVMGNLPHLRENILSKVPARNPLHEPISRVFRGESLPGQPTPLSQLLGFGQYLAGGMFELLLITILAIYLVVDGPRASRWALAFFPSPEKRRRIHQTANESSSLVFAYVAGQFITSLLVFVATFMAMKLLRVPAALTLAVLAGIFDVLPVLGFFLSAGPAILLALSVSGPTALAATAYFVGYHTFENYFIVPKVYGKRMRLNTLSVIVSLLAADQLAGISGLIAVLPVVAAYPTIERLWLRGRIVSDETVEKHEREAA
jgi:predicted PurR-regulated permease PerM